MDHKFKNIVLIGQQNATNVEKTLLDLINYLQTKKINIFLVPETAAILPNCPTNIIAIENLGNNCDLIIVVGGDGSMLNAGRIAAQQKLPVIGVNRGHLGFLSDIAPNNLAKIDEILSGKFCEEERFLLEAEISNPDQTITNTLALNDIVFLAVTPGRIISFSVYVDQQFLCAYNADGLIVSTPTGSTAHALSGGGPIIHPTLAAITLVPMLSHNLSSRPIVINDNSLIKIVFSTKNNQEVLVRCDGQVQVVPHDGIVQIKKASEKLLLLHPLDYNYFETLRTKLHWETK